MTKMFRCGIATLCIALITSGSVSAQTFSKDMDADALKLAQTCPNNGKWVDITTTYKELPDCPIAGGVRYVQQCTTTKAERSGCKGTTGGAPAGFVKKPTN
jgi:hypothetical protein